MSQNKPTSKPYIIILILLLALAVRLVYLKAFHNEYFFVGLVCVEAELAKSLIEGRGHVIYPTSYCNSLNEKKKLIDIEDFHGKIIGKPQPIIQDMPGYAYLLAFTWKIFGEKRYIYIQIIQVLLDVFCCYLLFRLATLLYGVRVGMLSAFLYATYFPQARLAVAALRDIWSTLVLIPLMFLIVREIKKYGIRISLPTYLAAGVLLGVDYYIRGSSILLPVFLSAGILLVTKSLKKSICAFAVMTLVMIVFMSPWIYRNYRVFNHLILTRPVMGQGLWEGLGLVKNPFGAVLDDGITWKQAVGEGYRGGYGTYEYNKFLMKKAITAIKEHPDIYFKAIALRTLYGTVLLCPNNYLYKFGQKYTYTEYKKKHNKSRMEFIKEKPHFFLIRLFVFILYMIYKVFERLLFFLMLAGFFLSLRHWRINLLVLSVPIYYLATTIPTHLEPRYILISTFPYLILSSIFIIYIYIKLFRVDTNISKESFYL
ncbi:MAG: glycosyltransferase family 39 protein [bacterium]